MSTAPEREHALAETPGLEVLLLALRRALTRQVFAYGIGTILGAASLWLAFAFLADWGLRVPHALRIFNGLVLLTVVTLFAWRDLLRPLQLIPDREGLALLLERAHPELHQLLISAVQFQRRGPEIDGDRELIAAVVAEAETRTRALSTREVLDPEAPRARLLLGLGGTLCLLALAVLHPLHARTFLERLLGGTTAWPQRTNLVLELPGLEPGTIVERGRERWRLRVARGTDIALLVTAEGVAPEEVTVHFDDGRDLVLNPTGGNLFRTLLRSCQEELHLYVTGGDDEDGLPRVEVEVLQPPDVEGLALAVRPPAYSSLPEALYFNQDIEVLKGSEITAYVLAAPRNAQGNVRFLPDDTLVALVPAPFPRAPDGAPGGATGETGAAARVVEEPAASAPMGLSFRCRADRTLGFRVELTDANGLSNPEPGLYRIRVTEDRPPELSVLAPARGEFETTRGGALPLRVRAEDDFGLASLGWRVRAADGAEDAAPLLSADLEMKRGAAQPGKGVRDLALGGARLEVDALGSAEAPLAVDSRFQLEFFARDLRAPEPNEGRSPPIRVRIVTPEELLRRLQDRLAQARLDALRLSDEQREKRTRVEELLDALDGDDTVEQGENLSLTAALTGERRVLANAQALSRNLAAAAEDVLYARLDDKAASLLEFYDARAAQGLDARFRSEPWRELARECVAGRLPGDGFAANLVKLVGLALEISEDHASAAVAALDAAEEATSGNSMADNLQAATEHSTRVLERTEVLLSELAEWDNFQNVLTLARDILNRQKALRDRTQQFATGTSSEK